MGELLEEVPLRLPVNDLEFCQLERDCIGSRERFERVVRPRASFWATEGWLAPSAPCSATLSQEREPLRGAGDLGTPSDYARLHTCTSQMRARS